MMDKREKEIAECPCHATARAAHAKAVAGIEAELNLDNVPVHMRARVKALSMRTRKHDLDDALSKRLERE